jgi:hypothetical protein
MGHLGLWNRPQTTKVLSLCELNIVQSAFRNILHGAKVCCPFGRTGLINSENVINWNHVHLQIFYHAGPSVLVTEIQKQNVVEAV